jgi:O-antigen ligase
MRAAFLLLSTGLILGYASLRFGGVLPADWNPCVLALGLVLLVAYMPGAAVTAPIDRLLYAAVLAVPAWALLQTVPLPVSWIAVLSPERAAMTNALLRFDPHPGWIPLSVRPEATLQYALRYMALSATFLVTRDLMWRLPGRQWLIAMPPLVIALLEATVGILQDSGATRVPVSGTFVNRDHFSAMLEMCLPFAAGAVFDFAPRGPRALAACAGACAAAVLMIGITLSVSRAGFFIALASLLVTAWMFAVTRLRGTARVMAVPGILVASAGAAFVLAPGQLLERMLASPAMSPDGPWLGDRLLFWKEAMHVVAAYPIFGCGFGGFVSAVAPYRATAVTRTLDYAHNDYLQFLAEGGVLAFAFAAIAGAIVARAAWHSLAGRREMRHRGLAVGCVVALAAGMFHSGVDLITYVPATAMLLCWIAGMVAGLEFDALH